MPDGNKPILPIGSDPDPVPLSIKAGLPVLDSQGDTIKVIVEHLRIEKRLVEGEGVRVRVRVVTDEVESPANVTLRTERIEVEHVPIGRVVKRTLPMREENGVTIIAIMPSVEHRQSKYLNNRAEVSRQPTRRRERQMQRFNSSRHAQRFLSARSRIHNHFQLRRHRPSAHEHRAARDVAFHTWREVVGVASAA